MGRLLASSSHISVALATTQPSLPVPGQRPVDQRPPQDLLRRGVHAAEGGGGPVRLASSVWGEIPDVPAGRLDDSFERRVLSSSWFYDWFYDRLG